MLGTPNGTDDLQVTTLFETSRSESDELAITLSRHKAQRDSPVPAIFAERVSVDRPPSRQDTEEIRRGS